MKYIVAVIFILSAVVVKADYWTQQTNFGGSVRAAGVGFCIGTKCYLGTGWNFSTPKKDFWEYDPIAMTWTQKADFGGGNRLAAVGFGIGSKGYVGTGIFNTVRNDLWEYDPLLNTWVQKADLPGAARNYAVGFALDGYGYIGTGYNSIATSYDDFWQYNPTTDSWVQKAHVGGGVRSSAVGFGMNGKGYIGTGYGAGPKNDFWEYDPVVNSWTQKTNVGGGQRSDATGFSVCGLGYICSGSVGSIVQNDLWEYNPQTNGWVQKSDLPGTARSGACAFSDGTLGYISLGFTQSLNGLNDFWKYVPDCYLLPIGLENFSASQEEKQIVVSWTTATELNNDYFTLEKSSDAQHFYTLAVVDGSGSSATALNYGFTDYQPISGLNYYRLKQTDFDGSFSFSKVVVVNFPEPGMLNAAAVTIYPNPVYNVATIEFSQHFTGELSIRIYDVTGRMRYNKSYPETFSADDLSLDLTSLSPGVYWLVIETRSGNITNKIIRD